MAMLNNQMVSCCKLAIENGPVEIVNLPINSMMIFQSVLLTSTRGYNLMIVIMFIANLGYPAFFFAGERRYSHYQKTSYNVSLYPSKINHHNHHNNQPS